MKSKAIQFLEANQSGDRSTFVDDAKWRCHYGLYAG